MESLTRDYKRRVLVKINTFGGTFMVHPAFYARQKKSKNYNFTINYIKLVRIL